MQKYFNQILLTAGREEEIYGWNLVSGQRVLETKSIGRSIYSLNSMERSDEFLCGDESGSLSVFSYLTLKLECTQQIHNKTIYQIKIIHLQKSPDQLIVTSSADGCVKVTAFPSLQVLSSVQLNGFIYDIGIHNNTIFAQIGKTCYLALIALICQGGQIQPLTKIFTLSNPQKVRCLQIIKGKNILIYESSSNETSFDMNIQHF